MVYRFPCRNDSILIPHQVVQLFNFLLTAHREFFLKKNLEFHLWKTYNQIYVPLIWKTIPGPRKIYTQLFHVINILTTHLCCLVVFPCSILCWIFLVLIHLSDSKWKNFCLNKSSLRTIKSFMHLEN